ncbi:hypothetical protein [Dictyobacter formicarum]|uniref:HMA domain-containing protein n=1 Tax=Dictyobacter formicarum TaxID=2778368 RepID=A0ABQ3VQU6_9CHLR|nr:hypothetical protein [Dictyobacter formicarum]GHO88237.1 hypothetical protein KSZ_62430 [Dictyobacter formicarum]
MCSCQITAARVIVCDECTTAILASLLGLGVAEEPEAQVPAVLTPQEYCGLVAVVNGYLDTLLPQEKEVRQW